MKDKIPQWWILRAAAVQHQNHNHPTSDPKRESAERGLSPAPDPQLSFGISALHKRKSLSYQAHSPAKRPQPTTPLSPSSTSWPHLLSLLSTVIFTSQATNGRKILWEREKKGKILTSSSCAELVDRWQCFKWCLWGLIGGESTVLGQKEVILVQKCEAGM